MAGQWCLKIAPFCISVVCLTWIEDWLSDSSQKVAICFGTLLFLESKGGGELRGSSFSRFEGVP